jgi:hypothetical protein
MTDCPARVPYAEPSLGYPGRNRLSKDRRCSTIPARSARCNADEGVLTGTLPPVSGLMIGYAPGLLVKLIEDRPAVVDLEQVQHCCSTSFRRSWSPHLILLKASGEQPPARPRGSRGWGSRGAASETPLSLGRTARGLSTRAPLCVTLISVWALQGPERRAGSDLSEARRRNRSDRRRCGRKAPGDDPRPGREPPGRELNAGRAVVR